MELITQPFGEFMFNALEKSLVQHKVQVTDAAKFYVLNLLKEYLNGEKFRTVPGFSEDESLTIMVKEALETQPRKEQILKFVAIGNHCFYMSSMFSGHVNRKFTDLGYCIEMGSTAYLQSGNLYSRQRQRVSHVYQELGQKFPQLTGAVSTALTANKQYTYKDILDLYEQYLKDNNRKGIEEILKIKPKE